MMMKQLAFIGIGFALLAADTALAGTRCSVCDDKPGWEVRGGVLAHDVGPFSSRKEDGLDFHGQLLFPSPDFLGVIGSPRPHIGGNVATNGISQAFAGLTWEYDFWKDLFVVGEFGGSVHNAEELTEPAADGRNSEYRFLGCRVLFRLAAGLGYRVTDQLSIQLYLDHISNANTCSNNEGLENSGIRIGYKF